jgi:3'(2'), 5'-bisphosphate nucleotidase
MNLWQHEFDVALGAVREAAVLARELRRQIGERHLRKADRSPVTMADFAVHALVAHRLARAFPDDPVVAEADAASLRRPEARALFQSVVDALHRILPDLAPNQILDAINRGRGVPGERFWTLDPIDGTKGFLRGDQYVVALALVVRGRVEVGLMGCPQLSLTDDPEEGVGSIVHAIRTRGAFCASLAGHELTRLRVSPCQ